MSSYQVEVRIRPDFAHEISAPWLRRVVASTLRMEEQPQDVGITLLITGDEEIRDLNREYRDTDRPTDVLAFGGSEGEPFVTPEGFPIYLGDVVVSYPRVVAQAEAVGHSVNEELALLLVHGCLHLLGYDHAGEEGRREMWERQEQIVEAVLADD
ncbi:MAG: rRNA maturation RNase YbeY [Anaerolineales bacterium]